MKIAVWLTGILLYTGMVIAQGGRPDSSAFDYRKIYSYALDGNIRAALALVESCPSPLSSKDRELKAEFETRFLYPADSSRYPATSSSIEELVNLFKDYWRKSLLDTAANYDSLLMGHLAVFLAARYPAAGLDMHTPDSVVGDYLTRYLQSRHLYTAGLGKTGRLFDLLVWQYQQDTLYSFVLAGDTTTEPVTFMKDFITLGWEEYATLGKHYPGGWTTPQSLYCVESAYDLHSEDFLISYLAHESRHYKDYILFPKLESTDLEYRAKLTELSLARTSLFYLIGFFIDNANAQSHNGHEAANYCVIRDLSGRLFHQPFQKDLQAWKKLDTAAINKAAAAILRENTALLKKKGKNVRSYVLLRS